MKMLLPSCLAGTPSIHAVSGVDPRTVTATSSSEYNPAASVTRSVNRNVSSCDRFAGAVKLVAAADAAERVTVVPPVCVHPYVRVSSASGSVPVPLSATVAPPSTSS